MADESKAWQQPSRQVALGGDAEHALELGGELGHGIGDLGGLLCEGSTHPLAEVWIKLNQLSRRHNQGEVIVDVVSESRKFTVQRVDLLGAKRDRFARQSHIRHLRSKLDAS